MLIKRLKRGLKRAIFEHLDNDLKNNSEQLLDSYTITQNATEPTQEYFYPDNWATNFKRWDDDVLSSSDFIKHSGLKKRTFHNAFKKHRLAHKKRKKGSVNDLSFFF